ncbi:uncharacterized protein LOC128857212 [Anastrepha ludens]|uniref:uncharacterized protein LOC128857212 n=1 Tax=Anastrepha ludens TaxID=28586 RepID=UPI0023B0C3AC|nr:uncharacterized protein LOC128857212 [Anastrepha ludens]
MDRRRQIRILASLILKNNYLFQKNLKLLFLKLLRNIKTINVISDVLVQTNIASILSQENGRKIWKIERNGTFWEHDVRGMDDAQFKEHFRLSKDAFRKVSAKVRTIEKTDSNMRSCIPLHKRVAIALFALGAPVEYSAIARLFGVGRSTVGEIVVQFCSAVCDNLADCINSYPPHPAEVKRIVDGFSQLGFPQCFGAIDGCHIEIEPNKEDAVDYCNSKGWYSVVLFASCDYNSKFTYIHIGSSGRNNDSYIFETSSLKKFHENANIFQQNIKHIEGVNVPVVLIGDSAFRLSRYLIKPFPYSPNQPVVEKYFNYRLSRCRRVVRNAFGQLKARFRKIGGKLQVAPKNVNTIIHACCILHNFLKAENDELPSTWMHDAAEVASAPYQPNHTTTAGENDKAATTIRNAIAQSFLADIDGPVTGASDDVSPVSTVGNNDSADDDPGSSYRDLISESGAITVDDSSEGGEGDGSWIEF